jgi:hypothetical protein
MALTNDPEGTRYYIDPKTASVVGTYSNNNWLRANLHPHRCHSLLDPRHR